MTAALMKLKRVGLSALVAALTASGLFGWLGPVAMSPFAAGLIFWIWSREDV